MRRLVASTFASLDGIMQAPGGPEEDPTGGFALGGWSFNYWGEGMDTSASGFDGKDRELVLGWNNSTLLHGDVVSAIIALRSQSGPDLQIIGSGNLIQTLQASSLIDEYIVWTFPLVLGRGKRLFGETAKPSALRLVRSRVSATGVVMSSYVPDGDVRPGSFVGAEPSEKELARRKRMASELR
jgi:hypothetical protein